VKTRRGGGDLLLVIAPLIDPPIKEMPKQIQIQKTTHATALINTVAIHNNNSCPTILYLDHGSHATQRFIAFFEIPPSKMQLLRSKAAINLTTVLSQDSCAQHPRMTTALAPFRQTGIKEPAGRWECQTSVI
jgi:hypothetical protein